MKLRCKIGLLVFSLLGFASATHLIVGAATDDGGDDSALSAAVCPLVYRLDESPSAHGYRYSFFGNAFFINEQGYVLTAAHLLETFRNGGQPSILLARANRPPQLVPVTVIAADAEHDVAILRANPNPFGSHYRVAFLSLASQPAILGQSVLAISLHPVHLQSAKGFQAPVEDRSPGQVLSYETTQLEKSAPAAEVFLLSHPVTLGQSGSPVLDRNSHAVLGLIEGRWVRNSLAAAAGSNHDSPEPPGAAVPIRYAISLLNQKGVEWHGRRGSPANTTP